MTSAKTPPIDPLNSDPRPQNSGSETRAKRGRKTETDGLAMVIEAVGLDSLMVALMAGEVSPVDVVSLTEGSVKGAKSIIRKLRRRDSRGLAAPVQDSQPDLTPPRKLQAPRQIIRKKRRPLLFLHLVNRNPPPVIVLNANMASAALILRYKRGAKPEQLADWLFRQGQMTWEQARDIVRRLPGMETSLPDSVLAGLADARNFWSAAAAFEQRYKKAIEAKCVPKLRGRCLLVVAKELHLWLPDFQVPKMHRRHAYVVRMSKRRTCRALNLDFYSIHCLPLFRLPA